MTDLLLHGTPKQFSWAELKAASEMAADEDHDREFELSMQAMVSRDASIEEDYTYDGSVELLVTSPSVASQSVPLASVEMSRSVVKWLGLAGHRYKCMFDERMGQLASGARSYALSKRLQGTTAPVYESKLFGFRILWTPVRRQDRTEPTVFVWYVCTHDRISYYAERIDTSLSRMMQRPALSDHCMLLTEATVLLDPLRNTPLKVHACAATELRQITDGGSWMPPLRLTQKQRAINSESGSVLLVGRSGMRFVYLLYHLCSYLYKCVAGTGKTICIGDRMRSDREASLRSGQSITQLFVTRSPRLCSFMKLYQQQQKGEQETGEASAVDYLSLSEFVSHFEAACCRFKGVGRTKVYVRPNEVTYARFRREVYPFINKRSECKLDALVVWTQVRSFIKGSIEAAHPLSKEQYMALPRSRCKLSSAEKGQVYEVYMRYEEHLTSMGLWDEVN